MIDFLKIAHAWLASFFKKEWRFEDYPLSVLEQEDAPPPGDLQPVRWFARLLRFDRAFGMGATREEAIARLRENFEAVRREEGLNPRPGTRVPIKVASTARIAAFGALRREFIEQVLELDAERTFVTDESNLAHFCLAQPIELFQARIRALYGVETDDLGEGNLAAILERIAAARGRAGGAAHSSPEQAR